MEGLLAHLEGKPKDYITAALIFYMTNGPLTRVGGKTQNLSSLKVAIDHRTRLHEELWRLNKTDNKGPTARTHPEAGRRLAILMRQIGRVPPVEAKLPVLPPQIPSQLPATPATNTAQVPLAGTSEQIWQPSPGKVAPSQSPPPANPLPAPQAVGSAGTSTIKDPGIINRVALKNKMLSLRRKLEEKVREYEELETRFERLDKEAMDED